MSTSETIETKITEAEGKGGRPAISFSYNIARAIIVLLPYPHYSPCSYCYEYK